MDGKDSGKGRGINRLLCRKLKLWQRNSQLDDLRHQVAILRIGLAQRRNHGLDLRRLARQPFGVRTDRRHGRRSAVRGRLPIVQLCLQIVALLLQIG